MFCPQCGTESSSGQPYCRSCGANLKAIAKAVSFEEMIEKRREKRRAKKEKTAAQRREKHIVQGLISLFSGLGLMVFLYYLSSVLILKLPDDVIAQVPFEIDPVVRMIWLVGLLPALTGVGRILAGLTIRHDPPQLVEFSEQTADDLRSQFSDFKNARPEYADHKNTNELAPGDESPPRNDAPPSYEPGSVTERTTNILNKQR
jgi:hypothetical protein